MLEIRLEPLQKDIELIFREDLSPEARSRTLAAFAREQLAEAEETNAIAFGHAPPHDTFVDGQAEASEDSVRPDGVVAYEFELIDDALAWIGEQLVIHSPVKTGRYQRSHAILADGTEVMVGEPLPPAAEYVFVNTQPYARKIEHGLSKQAPDGVYEAVATLARRRFGNVARIGFSYRDVTDLGRQPAITVSGR